MIYSHAIYLIAFIRLSNNCYNLFKDDGIIPNLVHATTLNKMKFIQEVCRVNK